METGLAVVAAFVVVYAAVAVRLERTVITAPIVFVAFGILISPAGLDMVDLGLENAATAVLAEITLALVLFADASRIDLRQLRRQAVLPLRLLLIGMPLTVAFGAAVAWAVFGDLSLAEALLIGAVLAPTDAALGEAIVTNDRIPVRVRQTLNVESGLNDGLAAPAFAFFLADVLNVGGGGLSWLPLALRLITLGMVVGVTVGAVGVCLGRFAAARGWTSSTWRRLSNLALALLAWSAAEALGGNGFIAAFVGGLTVGGLMDDAGDDLNKFLEEEGQVLSLLVWLIFGGALAGPMLTDVTGQVVLYAVLSLTVVRMIPVALSLSGTGLRLETVGLMAWFGPRGLASIVFGLEAVERIGGAQGESVLLVVAGTVLLSVVLHGASAQPLSRWYAHRTSQPGPEGMRAERESAPELRTRPAMRLPE